MKRIGIYLVIVCTFVSMNITAQVLPPDNQNWENVFIDEFDSLALDASKWNRLDWQAGLWKWNYEGTCDSIIFQPTAASENLSFDTTSSGAITLIAKKLATPVSFYVRNECDSPVVYVWHDFEYTKPAMLQSNNRWKYGYFELRAKLEYIDTTVQTIQGIGPNFWLFHGDFFNNPLWSEIDICEYQNFTYWNGSQWLVNRTPSFGPCMHYKECDTIGSSTCDDSLYHAWQEFGGLRYHLNDGAYHKYAAKWSPEKVDFYFDDELIFTENPFYCNLLSAMNVILDVAISKDPAANSAFDFDYTLDWVRVYQLKQHCDSDIVITSFNPATFDFSLYNTVTFGDGSNALSVSSGSPITFLSTDGFTINPGVTIENGTELTLDFETCQPVTRESGYEQSQEVLKERQSVKY